MSTFHHRSQAWKGIAIPRLVVELATGYELFNRGDVESWLATLSKDVELDER